MSSPFMILDWIQLTRHTLQTCSARGSRAAPEHHWATPRFTVGRMFFIMFASFFLLLIYWSEMFHFCFIAPQNRIPRLMWLIYMGLNILESISLVLLGQWWRFRSCEALQCLVWISACSHQVLLPVFSSHLSVLTACLLWNLLTAVYNFLSATSR